MAAEAATANAALSVSGLRSGYGGAEVLRGVSLHVGGSETVGVIGANGAGKTTLLRTICGTLGARGGVIVWQGARFRRPSAARLAAAGLVHVPEGSCVFGPMSVAENLEIGALAIGRRPAPEDYDRVFDLFPILRERRSQQAGNLSGGEQRMLAVARGLLMRPKLLVLDEPSTGLAGIVIRQLGTALRVLASSGLAILIAEQNLSLVEMLSDRVYLLDRGLVTWEGGADGLTENADVASVVVGGGPPS